MSGELTLQDCIMLKQLIEKCFRQNMFNYQEKPKMIELSEKLSELVRESIKLLKEKQQI